MTSDAIVIDPDGTIYNGGPGAEHAFESKLNHTYRPIIGRYQMGDPAKPVGPYGYQEIKDTMFTASLGQTYKTIRDNAYNLTNRMYKAAPEGITNSENIELLQLIRLHPELQALPETYFFLEAGFVTREIPHLEFREAFRDVANGPQYIDRLQQIPATDLKYDNINYSLNKLADKVYVPFEDIWRTIINPMKADYENVRWAFQRARNLNALAAIKTINKNVDGETNGETDVIASSISAIQAFDADSPYHSKSHTSVELMTLFSKFLKRNAVPITHVFMSVLNFAKYTENTWTRSGPNQLAPERPTRGGVMPLPGLQGIQAIVDVELPDNKMWAINKPNALRLGEGPKILRRYEDNERDAVAIKVVDFHQHLSVDAQLSKIDRNFAFELTVN